MLFTGTFNSLSLLPQLELQVFKHLQQMAFNSLTIYFETCTLCVAMAFYVRFVSSTCSGSPRSSNPLIDYGQWYMAKWVVADKQSTAPCCCFPYNIFYSICVSNNSSSSSKCLLRAELTCHFQGVTLSAIIPPMRSIHLFKFTAHIKARQ